MYRVIFEWTRTGRFSGNLYVAFGSREFFIGKAQ